MSTSTLAALAPWPSYCDHQSYTYEDGFCVFDNGEKCNAKDFYEGACGEEQVKEISCRQEGETVFSQFEQCCSGLEPDTSSLSQATCQKVSFFQSFWQWLSNLF